MRRERASRPAKKVCSLRISFMLFFWPESCIWSSDFSLRRSQRTCLASSIDQQFQVCIGFFFVLYYHVSSLFILVLPSLLGDICFSLWLDFSASFLLSNPSRMDLSSRECMREKVFFPTTISATVSELNVCLHLCLVYLLLNRFDVEVKFVTKWY